MTRCYLNIAIISFALLLRILVGIHPHSGQDDYQGPNNTPANSNTNKVKYGGDYEAQRHWMELTYHLPINQWYYHDLQYWGLDYPPLTAYVSWVFGFVAHHVGSFHDDKFIEEEKEVIIHEVCQLDDETCIEEQGTSDFKVRRYSKGLGVLKDLVALQSSRWGFEDSRGKLYMRFTVVISDLLIYISAVWVIVGRLTKQKESIPDTNIDDTIPTYLRPRLWLLLTALSQPALILIDHGHFQYNTLSLGLALWSFHFISSSTNEFGPIVGSILFSLALNFKQMELYHAPAVFAYLLGRCFRHANRYTHIIANFIALGVTVILTFAVLWFPFVIYPPSDATSNDGVLQIIKRVFPFQRGLFEGKVANIWCALSIKPFSIRSRIPENLLPLAALALTLVLILPPCWMLFKVGRGDKLKPLLTQPNDDSDIRLLLWGTASTSLAFFLASFQVHEKGILIPLTSISLLMLDAPNFVQFFSIAATWSLWPLLVIDRLTDAYICCLGIFLCINCMMKVSVSYDRLDIFSKRYITRYCPTLAWIVMILLHVLEMNVAPPSHLPDLYPVLWSFVGCGLFCLSYLATVWAMFAQFLGPSEKRVQKVKEKSKPRTRMSPISLLGLVLLSSYTKTNDAFVQHRNIHNSYTHSLRANSETDTVPSLFTDDLLERARRPLSWEEKVATEKKPVLNLSAVRNLDTLSLADGANMDDITDSNEIHCEQETDNWIDGHIWQATEQHLIDIGIMETEKILRSAPQLLRLPTKQVVEAVNFLHSYPTGKNSTDLINADPSLLTYLADDLRYGLEEYLPNMMFMGNQDTAAAQISNQFALSPSLGLQLIRMGIEGGLEERHISRALNDASTASSKATEGIVGEVGKSFKQLQRIKGRKS